MVYLALQCVVVVVFAALMIIIELLFYALLLSFGVLLMVSLFFSFLLVPSKNVLVFRFIWLYNIDRSLRAL